MKTNQVEVVVLILRQILITNLQEMCSSKRGELIKSWELKVKRLTTTKLLLLIMMMMMMMAMTKTMGITKITTKKKIKKIKL